MSSGRASRGVGRASGWAARARRRIARWPAWAGWTGAIAYRAPGPAGPRSALRRAIWSGSGSWSGRAIWSGSGWARAALLRARSVTEAAGGAIRVATGRRRGRSWPQPLWLRSRRARCLALGFFGVLAIPAPDGPVVRAAVLLALEVEARDGLKDLQPVAGITTNLDLRARWAKRVEGLVEQIAHHARLWLIASRTNVADRQVVVHAHMALDEASQLPVLGRSIVVFEDEDVAACRGPTIALAAALVVRVGQRTADRFAQRHGVVHLGGADAICQTTFFHGACCRTA
jgi:hypothetical protein